MPTVVDLSALGSIGFSIQGDAAIDWAGWRVSEAGDVNGDGFDDILVGAPLNVGAGDIGGAAYLIFGRSGGFGNIDLSNLAASDGFVINGDGDSYYAGQNISGAGDVNGDGFDDLIISGVDSAPGGTRGSAYVIFGKAAGFGTVVLTSLAPSDGFVIQGKYAAGRLHTSSAGDVNGDGFDDMIVGARLDNNAAGSAYVIFGKGAGFGTIDLANLSSSAGFAILGAASGDMLGRSVSDAGDVNGDGFDDLIVGAYNGDLGGADSGQAYVIFGKASGFGTVNVSSLAAADGFIIQGDAAGDWTGFSVSAAGDVNGDGFDDVIVGAPQGDNGGANAGEAYVIFGKASGFGTIDLTNFTSFQGFIVQGDANGDQAGFSVSGAGDVNGDGFDDIIIGAPYGDDGGADAGNAYVIYGHSGSFGTVDLTDLPTSAGFIIQGDVAGDQAGWSVSRLGDINGDGGADIIVGAPLNNDGGIEAGKAYVIFGTGTFPSADARNDFNGDGRDDVLLRHHSGIITEWLGQADGGFFSNHAVAAYGLDVAWHVAGAGDFNGDGRDDVLLKHDNGSVTNWLGQANGSFFSNHTVASYALPAGWHVVSTGDFNGDTLDDVVLRHDGGTVTNWLGQANGSFFSNHAVAAYALDTAWTVSGTGDFNGDGKSDLLLVHDNGSVTNWLGQANGSHFSNHAAASYALPAGWQIDSVGDFNGDGKDDLLLRHDNGTITNWLGQAGGTFLSNHAAANYSLDNAWQIAGVGDFNGDGKDDLLLRHDNGTITNWLGQVGGTFASNHLIANYPLDTAWHVEPDDLWV